MKWEYEEKIAELEAKAERLALVVERLESDCEFYMQEIDTGHAGWLAAAQMVNLLKPYLKLAKGETDVD